jgi:hypothetical protein
MSPENPIYIFPQATGTAFLMAVLVAFALMGVAVMLELRRRRQQERQRLEAEWQGVDNIMRDKELAPDQCEQLRGLIQRYADDHPYRFVTQRTLFDRAVHEEIERQRPHASVDALETVGAELRALRGALGLEFVPIAQSIHSTRNLYRSQKIWVALASGGRGNLDWHQMTVRDVDEAYFHASPENGPLPGAAKGSVVRCKMWREDDGRYTFESVIARAHAQPPSWMLEHTDQLTRTQTRAYFRVPVDQPAELAVVPVALDGHTDDLLQKPETMRIKGRITSLSAGGFAASVTQPLPPQMALRCVIKLGATGSLNVAGKIVGSQELYGGRYLVRCAFAGLSEEDRDAIAHFVSLWQRRAQHEQESGR